MSITVIVENGMVKLPAEVPDGTRVEVILPATEVEAGEPKQGEPLSWMVEFAGCIDTLPPDASERHTEYAHGRKRRL